MSTAWFVNDVLHPCLIYTAAVLFYLAGFWTRVVQHSADDSFSPFEECTRFVSFKMPTAIFYPHVLSIYTTTVLLASAGFLTPRR